MAKRVLGEGWGSVSNAISLYIFVDDVFEIANSLLTLFSDVVKPCFEFASPLLLGRFGDRPALEKRSI